MSSPITTHVLDTARGRPAEGIPAVLEYFRNQQWQEIGRGTTNADGRIRELLSEGWSLEPGVYRITFQTQAYFQAHGGAGFYPYVPIVFELQKPEAHYHVPLLLSPFGYSTYRGS